MKTVALFQNMHILNFTNMIIYMIQTLQMLANIKGEEFVKAIAECGRFQQTKDGVPFLIIEDEDKLNSLI